MTPSSHLGPIKNCNLIFSHRIKCSLPLCEKQLKTVQQSNIQCDAQQRLYVYMTMQLAPATMYGPDTPFAHPALYPHLTAQLVTQPCTSLPDLAG